jgi:lipopolysaccharide/colanic/teichoic acid biosynthesis glycosyltransferase
MKRGMDLVLAVGLLILATPAMILAVLAIKITSPGPVIFRQQRLGKGRAPFTCYKLRSMHADASGERHRLFIETLLGPQLGVVVKSGKKYKLTNDPRVTAVGRFLRRTSMD